MYGIFFLLPHRFENRLSPGGHHRRRKYPPSFRSRGWKYNGSTPVPRSLTPVIASPDLNLSTQPPTRSRSGKLSPSIGNLEATGQIELKPTIMKIDGLRMKPSSAIQKQCNLAAGSRRTYPLVADLIPTRHLLLPWTGLRSLSGGNARIQRKYCPAAAESGSAFSTTTLNAALPCSRESGKPVAENVGTFICCLMPFL
jgi:hypothetical protein